MSQETCERCLKPQALCFCSEIQPLSNEHEVLILQHPQEPDEKLGSARLTELSLSQSKLKTGLSWRNLSHALGREVDAKKWAVLYLGSGVKDPSFSGKPGLYFVSKKAELLPASDSKKISSEIEGIVLLDGTWSQAKALWWRNAWLLKLRRAILVPSEKSLYRELRREPRSECLSTIETIAETLTYLGESPMIAAGLKTNFSRLLDLARKKKA